MNTCLILHLQLYVPVYQIPLCCEVFRDLVWLPPWLGDHSLSSETRKEAVRIGQARLLAARFSLDSCTERRFGTRDKKRLV